MFEKIEPPPPSGIFAKCVFALELSSQLSFKAKKQLKDNITKNGGVISYIINKKV